MKPWRTSSPPLGATAWIAGPRPAGDDAVLLRHGLLAFAQLLADSGLPASHAAVAAVTRAADGRWSY
jgi:hypothetical protein